MPTITKTAAVKLLKQKEMEKEIRKLFVLLSFWFDIEFRRAWQCTLIPHSSQVSLAFHPLDVWCWVLRDRPFELGSMSVAAGHSGSSGPPDSTWPFVLDCKSWSWTDNSPQCTPPLSTSTTFHHDIAEKLDGVQRTCVVHSITWETAGRFTLIIFMHTLPLHHTYISSKCGNDVEPVW